MALDAVNDGLFIRRRQPKELTLDAGFPRAEFLVIGRLLGSRNASRALNEGLTHAVTSCADVKVTHKLQP